MPRLSVVLTLVTGVALTTGVTSTLASQLYQWTSKDGTPTYSPDPPPAGVKYELVGADLKPLPKNIDLANQAATAAAESAAKAPARAATPPKLTANVLQKPTPTQAKKPSVPWKPVRYANDPNPQRKAQGRAPAKNIEDPIAIARNSPACARARQRMVLLESLFAKAVTDEQMDSAVLQLREHKPALQSACRLN